MSSKEYLDILNKHAKDTTLKDFPSLTTQEQEYVAYEASAEVDRIWNRLENRGADYAATVAGHLLAKAQKRRGVKPVAFGDDPSANDDGGVL